MGKTKQRKFFGKTIAGFIIKLFSNFQPFPMFENLQQNNQVVQKKYFVFTSSPTDVFCTVNIILLIQELSKFAYPHREEKVPERKLEIP